MGKLSLHRRSDDSLPRNQRPQRIRENPVDETTGLTELPAKSIAEAAEEGSFTTVLTGRYDPQDMLS